MIRSRGLEANVLLPSSIAEWKITLQPLLYISLKEGYERGI